MEIAKRNRLIKKVLEQHFGRGNVRVRGDRGTAYGWVSVTITAPNDERYHYRSERTSEVEKLLRDAKIEIGTYGYDDPGSDYGYGSKINISFREPQPSSGDGQPLYAGFNNVTGRYERVTTKGRRY